MNCSEPEPIAWNGYDATEEDGGQTCPVFLMIERGPAFKAFALFERGLLPEAGGWSTQQEWWLQVFEVIDVELRRVQLERAAADKAQAEQPTTNL